MIFPEIKGLYKYTPVNDKLLGALIKGKFWFSRPANFNDPFDCGIQLAELHYDEVLSRLVRYRRRQDSASRPNAEKVSAYFNNHILYTHLSDEQRRSLVEEASFNKKDLLEGQIKECGILSLSEINDNVLMWSHYADQHKGICIEFSRENGNDLADNSKTLPVRYSIKKPIITRQEERDGDADSKKEIRRSLIYTKSIDWQYEREWRVVLPDGDAAHEVNARIKSIIFGVKTPLDVIETLTVLLQKLPEKISLKRAVLKKGSFGLDVQDIKED